MPYTKVMHKWGEGSLHSGGKHGPTVPHTKAGQKQALAIMYSEKRRGTTDAAGFKPGDPVEVETGRRGSWSKGTYVGPHPSKPNKGIVSTPDYLGRPQEFELHHSYIRPARIKAKDAMGCDCWDKLIRGWCKGAKDAEPFHTPSGGVSEAGRERAEAKGQTMRGGRFPIRNLADLAKAKHDVGRAKNPAAVRRWINKRAEELGGRKLGEAKDSGGAGLSSYLQNRGVPQGQAAKAVSKQPRLKHWSRPTVREVER